MALSTSLEIYAEILIGKPETQNINEKIETVLNKPKKELDLIGYYKLVFNSIGMLKILDQNNIAEFKKMLDQSISIILFIFLRLFLLILYRLS